jgi:hypothetical protein
VRFTRGKRRLAPCGIPRRRTVSWDSSERAQRPRVGLPFGPSSRNLRFGSCTSALLRTRETSEASQRISSRLVRQHESADILPDCAHAVSGRAQELSGGFTRMADTLERLSLIVETLDRRVRARASGAHAGSNARYQTQRLTPAVTTDPAALCIDERLTMRKSLSRR